MSPVPDLPDADAISAAIERSASESMYVWQLPPREAKTGTVAFARMLFFNRSPPRGIRRSTSPSARRG